MNRRKRILEGMGVSPGSGGTQSPRRVQIKKALGEQGPTGDRRTPPATSLPDKWPSSPTAGASVRQPGSPGVGKAMQPGLGAQLSNRVSSGVISQAQARKTAQQRQMLQKAFGSDWRSQVFGKGGAKGISGPFSVAQVRTKRNQGLERAKRKLKGGIGGGMAA